MATAEDLATELRSRGIAARIGQGSDFHSCEATINNIPVGVNFSRDPEHRSIRWQANDDGVRTIADRNSITASELADQVIDSLINPA
jgi:hypothetical protein